MALLPIPQLVKDPFTKPGMPLSDLLSPEEGNILQKLGYFARDVGKEGANLQESIKEKAPYLAPITSAFIPQNTLSVVTTPLSLATLASKAPLGVADENSSAIVKSLVGGFQGLLNAAGKEGEKASPKISQDIIDQIANEGRDQNNANQNTTSPSPNLLGPQIEQLMGMLESGETVERPTPNKFKEFFDRWLANQQGRNYDLEQLQLAGAYADPADRFRAEVVPGLLKFYMEQSARASRDMEVESYKNRLMRERFDAYRGLANPLQANPLQ